MEKILNRQALLILIIFTSLFTICSCSKEDPDLVAARDALQSYLDGLDQASLDAELAVIDDSLDNWGLTDSVFIESQGGVRYVLHSEGLENAPQLNSILTFNYKGKLLKTGKTFDSGNNLQAYLYQLIPGFQTTLPNIKEGSILTMYIPSMLGYGDQDVRNEAGVTTIPANSNLIFEIELVDVY